MWPMCLYFGSLLAVFLASRIVYLLYIIHSSNHNLKLDKSSLRTIVCIGSGGHTNEMLRILNYFKRENFSPRLYVMADNDANSEIKVHSNESIHNSSEYKVDKIPRSRNVKQPWVSSFWSSVYATVYTLPVVFNFKPDLVLCNGPGTCIPVCLVAFVMRMLFIKDCRIVFIESICRVRTLSMSGKILQYIADVFIVQWPYLKNVNTKSHYFGRLT